jgi:hypothetical protein
MVVADLSDNNQRFLIMPPHKRRLRFETLKAASRLALLTVLVATQLGVFALELLIFPSELRSGIRLCDSGLLQSLSYCSGSSP